MPDTDEVLIGYNSRFQNVYMHACLSSSHTEVNVHA